jgi:hypothetical protein
VERRHDAVIVSLRPGGVNHHHTKGVICLFRRMPLSSFADQVQQEHDEAGDVDRGQEQPTPRP